MRVKGAAWYVRAVHGRQCIADLRLSCLHFFMLRCFDCHASSTASGCYDAWARAYTAAFGAGSPLPDEDGFLDEAQRLFDALRPYDALMHSLPSAWQ